VDRARVGGAPAADGAPGPDEGGADLAGFIAELRAEIEQLRAWKGAAEAAGIRVEGPAEEPASRAREPEPVVRLAERLRDEGRVGLTGRDAERMKELLPTRTDRVLYEGAMERLGAKDPDTRVRAARALEALGSKAAAPLLAAALGHEPEAEVKAALLGALARLGEPFAAELAERELRDTRPQVRVAALEALAAVAGDAAQDRLARALADESPLVRRRAALLLGFSRGSRVEELLAGALGDPDRGVARAAAAALSGRPSTRAQNALARALEHRDPSVRRAASGALSRWTGERVDADAPANDRRRAARKIAERLAGMDGSTLREAVLAASPAVSAAVAPALSRRPAAPSPAPVPAPSPAPTSTATRTATSARTATATLVAEPAEPEPGGLDDALVLEVRASLRGRTAAELSGAVGAPLPRVESALQALAARGALALRGTRWFTS
jgi:hypothetical protein